MKLGPIVQKVDNATHKIDLYLEDKLFYHRIEVFRCVVLSNVWTTRAWSLQFDGDLSEFYRVKKLLYSPHKNHVPFHSVGPHWEKDCLTFFGQIWITTNTLLIIKRENYQQFCTLCFTTWFNEQNNLQNPCEQYSVLRKPRSHSHSCLRI